MNATLTGSIKHNGRLCEHRLPSAFNQDKVESFANLCFIIIYVLFVKRHGNVVAIYVPQTSIILT